MTAEIGRTRGYLVGVQSAQGTEATNFFPIVHEDGTRLSDSSSTIPQRGGFGRIEGSLGTQKLKSFSSPKIVTNADVEVAGLLLYSVFGSVNTVANSPETGLYTHSMEVYQNNIPRFLTIKEKNVNGFFKVMDAALSSLSISFSAEDFVKFDASFFGKYPESSTGTYLIPEYNSFTFGHAKVKIAPNIAGLATGTELTLNSFTLNGEKNVEQRFSGGVPTRIYNRDFAFNGSFERVFEDNTFRDLLKNGDKVAMEVTLEHDKAFTGKTAKPKIVFTFPKIQLSERTESGNLDDLQSESFSFENAAYDIAEGYAVKATIINTTASFN